MIGLKSSFFLPILGGARLSHAFKDDYDDDDDDGGGGQEE